MKVAITTLGCRVNVYESEAMLEIFKKDGFQVVDYDEFADVYVINTCTVTNTGDKKSRQLIRRAKRQNENAIVAVVGCYSQVASEEVKEIEGVDIVLGTRNKSEILYWVNRVLDEHKQFVVVNDVLKNNKFEKLKIEEYSDKTRAFLKIQDGCNNFCSYCLIPYARGAVCSKDRELILEEANELSKNGFKEIILSGIHTASYGVDLKEDIDLMTIVEDIDKIEGIERIRIGSIDPTFFTEDIINRMAKVKKMCPHFHLSLQSGCDETLKRMNRKYTAQQYKECVEKLREVMPTVAITTDVIVGFPGETHEEFEKTYEFLKDLKLAKTHVFRFSPRTGTRAAKMENQVDGKVSAERSARLIELNDENERTFMERFIGTEAKVLFEEEISEGIYTGYTENYLKVNAKSDKNIIGAIEKVNILSVEDNTLVGEA
ncbi:tRNA (N(6)-L-threonylcarbamoyladenosine(37)-C(2))-methylthiotransferase MtaB [Oceanirhabdus sp. W0125-5]|uniref:tRNA (N(6)-L-threonylcarbamoyladenosine(37)-C(2))- methylthiotransferase MtaB n=1 Tax=Oceanirhabdus sp. W0125-5 TaxID=2999116 RepID=UPI0022F32CB8|nr:tRNA (N(6)-L-threonylcarbamoyladenosine(37)-C(2))-methylthiotransferase MtaB [Oceanirhabdus sp. W0125-5]WBW95777.1 tRNA (N(6)-L-threonylcarbamoyladenosine(37)-C(2))-methylthiotransferase MtaB [Oceanirhabdus sp. W0125-5]